MQGFIMGGVMLLKLYSAACLHAAWWIKLRASCVPATHTFCQMIRVLSPQTHSLNTNLPNETVSAKYACYILYNFLTKAKLLEKGSLKVADEASQPFPPFRELHVSMVRKQQNPEAWEDDAY